jgi:lysine-ketoglutarate reductase/saccharopine dehydrogenase-like protein (TIGR00300 family)
VPVSETVEISGHLKDTGVLAPVLDDVLEYGGDYVIDRFDVGRTAEDESHVVVTVRHDDDESLQRLLMRLQAHGMNAVDPGEAVIRRAERDGVFPDNFYATTNLETVVRLGGHWVPVDSPEMNCGLKVDDSRVRTVPVSDVRAGDQVVCGAAGVKVVLPVHERSTRADSAFAVADSAGHSDQAPASLVRQIAARMREVKDDGGRILWVAGPAVVHAGGCPALVTLVEAGYVDVLFAGNALATRDIEAAMLGRLPAVDLSRAAEVDHGHEHHIRAINAIRKAGSIVGAVEQGLLTSGIMHALVRKGARFVLVGSVRDDGPLPDVHTDVVEGQRAMRMELRGVGLTVMVATRLHSIATGNILPASVPLVCVDINPATVTRLAERVSGHGVGIVTDTGLFLEQLVRELIPSYGAAAVG